MTVMNGTSARKHLQDLLRGDMHRKPTGTTLPEREPLPMEVLPVNTHQPYPIVQICPGIFARRIRMTPEIAEALAARLMSGQRPKKKLHYAAMVRDVSAGRFVFNGQTVILDENGSLIDGQHRVDACIETGVTIDVLAVWGVPSDVRSTTNCSVKERGADILKRKSITSAAIFNGALNYLARYISGNFRSTLVLSAREIEALADEHPGLQKSVLLASRCRDVSAQPSALAFCHYVFSRINEEVADQIFEQLATGEGLKNGDPVFALRKKLIKNRQPFDNSDFCVVMFRIWNAVRNEISITAISTPVKGAQLPELT